MECVSSERAVSAAIMVVASWTCSKMGGFRVLLGVILKEQPSGQSHVAFPEPTFL